MPILRITAAEVVGDRFLKLTFSDGVRKTVNVGVLLGGPMFEPLKDPNYFARMRLDAECGTVVWPNGADFAPEALYALAAEESPARA